MLKNNVPVVYSTKTNINSLDNLALGKALNMHIVVIIIKFVFNENYCRICYLVFLEKFLYKLTR